MSIASMRKNSTTLARLIPASILSFEPEQAIASSGALQPRRRAASAVVSAIYDTMVGEALAHVQGESLKADADPAGLRSCKLPDPQSGAFLARYKRLGVMILAILSGCVTVPLSTPLQLNEAKIRTYENLDAQTFTKAVDVVFAGYEVTNGPSGITARNTTFRFAIVTVTANRETWDISIQERGSKLVASASVSARTGDFIPLVSRPVFGEVPLYELFWARVDYVLGR